MIRAAPLLLLFALTGCGGGDSDDRGPGGVSASEARQLDAAAARADINATFASNEAEPTP